jgi:hypothetical protein
MRLAIGFFLVGILLFAIPVSATVLHVPSQYTTIQAGINASVNGDTVLVSDGHYYERINFRGKGIIVASLILLDNDSLHIQNTIIDGDTLVLGVADSGSVVCFANNETSSSLLQGFTIQNGIGTINSGIRKGGGIYCNNGSSPSIVHCNIMNNLNFGLSFLNMDRPLLQSCLISNNDSGGVQAYGGLETPIVFDSCRIYANNGYGFLLSGNDIINVRFYNSIISNNERTGIVTRRHADYFNCRIENNGGAGITSWRLIGIRDEFNELEYTYQDSVINCVIKNNAGTGLRYEDGATVIAINDTIDGNIGGVSVSESVRLYMIDCVISNNVQTVISYGGGVSFQSDPPAPYFRAENCLFINNQADEGGAIGGLYGGYPHLADRLELVNCQFIRNQARVGGAINVPIVRHGHLISGCTFSQNTADSGSAFYVTASHSSDSILILNSIFAFNGPGSAVSCHSPVIPTIRCTDIYGNPGGDWVDSIASQTDSNGNFSADPMFCDTVNGNYTIYDRSLCAPENSNCRELVGALGVGCTYVNRAYYVATTGNDSIGTGSGQNPFRTIQHGIDVSSDGDTVLVAPGIYFENLYYAMQNIIIASQFLFSLDSAIIRTTIIDGDSSGNVINISGGQDSSSLITGFTIRNGFSDYGGGMYISNSSPRIINNILRNNKAIYGGGAISAQNSSQFISGNIIEGNIVTLFGFGDHAGAGVWMKDCPGSIIEDNKFLNNIAQTGCGGGLIIYSCSNSLIRRNIFSANYAGSAGGGFYMPFDEGSQVFDNTICFNEAGSIGRGSGIDFGGGTYIIKNNIISNNHGIGAFGNLLSNLVFIYNDVWGNDQDYSGFTPGIGCISLNPLFIGGDPYDFYLGYYSPCIDAGDPSSPLDPDGTYTEMGALTYTHVPPPLPLIINPPNGSQVDTSTYLTWLISNDSLPPNTPSYAIQLDNDSAFASPEVNQAGLRSGAILDDAFAIRLGELEGQENLQADTRYFWRVRADDNYGLSSDWTDGTNWFVYMAQNHPPNAPDSGFFPTGGEEVISLTPLITWANGSDPDPDDHAENLSYAIRLSTDSSFIGFIYYDTTGIGLNQIQPVTELADNAHYYYEIKTIDDGGLSSGWSARQDFWTNHYNFPPEPFPLMEPLAGTKQVVANTHFTWGHTVDFDPNSSFTYSIQFSPDSTFQWIARQVAGVNDTAITVATDTIALVGAYPFWRVVAVDDDGLIRIGGIPEQARRMIILPPGDANSSGNVTGLDVVYLVNYFKSKGPAPDPLLAGDANGSCSTTGLDVTFLVRFFKGMGPAPRRCAQ